MLVAPVFTYAATSALSREPRMEGGWRSLDEDHILAAYLSLHTDQETPPLPYLQLASSIPNFKYLLRVTRHDLYHSPDVIAFMKYHSIQFFQFRLKIMGWEVMIGEIDSGCWKLLCSSVLKLTVATVTSDPS